MARGSRLQSRDTGQLSLLEEELPQEETTASDTSTTFIGNLSLPIHRWFRYTAGFSAEWAGELITAENAAGRNTVLDPFAGSWTTGVAALLEGRRFLGCEITEEYSSLAPERLAAANASAPQLFSAGAA